MSDVIHSRRLYFSAQLTENVVLEQGQHHYIRNVLRMQPGDIIRLFNENDGEWIYKLEKIDKKRTLASRAQQRRKASSEKEQKRVLIAPILAKDRMFWMLEKATELGMTDFLPIITERSDIRQFKEDKAKLQVIEAAEQSERLTIPTIHSVKPIKQVVIDINDPIYTAIERCKEAKSVQESYQDKLLGDYYCLIGPAGGFSDDDKAWLLDHKNIVPIDLGDRILRVETAAYMMLAAVDIFS